MKEVNLCEIYGAPVEGTGAIGLLGVEKGLVDENGIGVLMEVTASHLNTNGTAHGGILYALCDQAVGAYMAYRKIAASGMDGEIHYYRPAKKGDILQAMAYPRKTGRRVSVFLVVLKNQDDELLADGLFTAIRME